MDLVRDLLDKRLVDRNGREMGRVDGIILQLRDGAAPTVAAVEIGFAVLAYRVHPVWGRLAAALEHALGIERDRPIRIPIGRLAGVHGPITVDAAVGETGAGSVEQWLRRRISRLPRSS